MDCGLTEAANSARHVRGRCDQHPMGGSIRAEQACRELRILECVPCSRLDEDMLSGKTRLAAKRNSPIALPSDHQLRARVCTRKARRFEDALLSAAEGDEAGNIIPIIEGRALKTC